MSYNVQKIKTHILKKYSEFKEKSIREPLFIVAVDFDGTLFENDFPNIGTPIYSMIDMCKDLQKLEYLRLVLWTCRCNDALKIAVRACEEVGLEFSQVNQCPEENLKYWTNLGYTDCSPKLSAHVYIDDLSLNPLM